MNHKEQQLAVFYVVGLCLSVLLVEARFGLGVGLMAVLAILLMPHVCGKALL